MGKLLEALKKQLNALTEHQKKKAPDYITDPAGAYAHLAEGKRLEYKRSLMSQGLNEAFARLTAEQRYEFYRNSASPEQRAAMARNQYWRTYVDAVNHDKLPGFLLNPDSFGCKLEELISHMEAIHRENRNEELLSIQDLSREERALRLFRKMDIMERYALYDRAATQEARQRYEAAYLERQVAEKKLGGSLVSDNFYGDGKSWQAGIEALESILKPEELDEITARFENIPEPENSSKLVYPEAEQLNRLRAQAEGDPRKLALVEQASRILRYPSNRYLEYLDSKSSGCDVMAEDIHKNGVERFVNSCDNGILRGKLPDTRNQGAKYATFNPVDVTPRYRNGNARAEVGTNLNDAEQAALRNGSQQPMPPAAKKALEDIIKGFEAIGEKKYRIPEALDMLEGSPENPTRVHYRAEQGNKKYAFWPLVKAKEALRKSVQAGDWAGIEANSAEYQRIKDITDRMMETARNANPLPIFPGNMNSTRPEQSDALNSMPVEYLEDYSTHSRVNGAYVLYVVSKNLGVSVSDMLDNPGQIFRQEADRFIQSKTLDAFQQESLGARLAKSLNAPLQLAAEQEWSSRISDLNRTGDTLASFCSEEQDRSNLYGRNFSALASANYTVGLEIKPWRAMATANSEKKSLIARMAMLLPEEELDLKALGGKLQDKDWEKTVNPAAELRRLRKNGQLDYSAIVNRSRQVIEDATQTELQLSEGQKKAFYEKAALQNYRLLMRQASEAERSSNGFKAMAAHAAELQNLEVRQEMTRMHDSFGRWRQHFNRGLEALARDKSGWFLTSENSPEYDRMMKGLKAFNAKLDLLDNKIPQGFTPEELEKLRQADPAELYQQARRGCMDYSCEKTNYGNDNILHKAGRIRNRAAQSCAEMLGNLADSFGLRSPAMALKENAELEVLRKRGSERWQSQNGELSAAKALCGMFLEQQGVGWETQERLLSEQQLNSTLGSIRKKPQFRQMVRNLQGSGLCGKVVRGASALTTAYNQAGQQLQQEQQRRALTRQAQLPKEAPQVRQS